MNMSIVDKFYEIFPKDIVLKILKWKPHDTALLIKEDLKEIGCKNLDLYSRLFEYNRLLHRLRTKNIKIKNELDEKIKSVYIDRAVLLNKIKTQQMVCQSSSSCRTLLTKHLNICDDCDNIIQYCADAINCRHADNVKNAQNSIRKCDVIIKQYTIERLEIIKKIDVFKDVNIHNLTICMK